MKGYVKWFDNRKGYGFITPAQDDGTLPLDNDKTNDIFVHFSNVLMEGFKKLDQGDLVEFEVKESDNKAEAINVKALIKDRRF